jgi:hypothetical protein
MFHEWVQNAADIDRARIVWASDLGDADNEKLERYYPDRTAWLVEPDAHPPRLTPYRPAAPEVLASPSAPPEAKRPAENPPATRSGPPKLGFEPVPEAKNP